MVEVVLFDLREKAKLEAGCILQATAEGILPDKRD